METITRARERGILFLRLLMGGVFLWAGTEKVLQVSGAPFDAAGFLKFGTMGTWPGAAEGAIVNPTHTFWAGLATDPALMTLINFIVPFGQVAIGAALILGLFTRFASAMGTLMMLFFFVAAWDFGHGILNSHLVYAFATGFLGYAAAGEIRGLDGSVLKRISFVQRRPALRYVLG